eukprot:12381908-Alexandrium_andersonii.AAC.1
MVCKVADVLGHMEHWAESCPCHGHLPEARRLALAKRWEVSSCPLATRRAPELATGAFRRFLAALLELGNNE